jgi:hypothetical protein
MDNLSRFYMLINLKINKTKSFNYNKQNKYL